MEEKLLGETVAVYDENKGGGKKTRLEMLAWMPECLLSTACCADVVCLNPARSDLARFSSVALEAEVPDMLSSSLAAPPSPVISSRIK